MKLITKPIYDQLLSNGKKQAEFSVNGECIDFPPVVKLFTPDASCTWLLSEIDPDYPDHAFGLCDLGLGFPELGNISLTELGELRGGLGLPVERDLHFNASQPISVYAHAAKLSQGITEDNTLLKRSANHLFNG